MELICGWSRVERELGVALRDNFLMPVRTLDNPKAFAPAVLYRGDKRWGLFQGIEDGNVRALALPPDLGAVYMRAYFTFDTIDSDPHMPRDIGEAVQSVAGGETAITVDAETPVALHDRLARDFAVTVDGGAELDAVRVRQVPRAAVRSLLDGHTATAASRVLELLDANPARDAIRPYLENRDHPHFEALDALLTQAGLAGVVVTSLVNVQEIAGIPVADHRRPIAVVYPTGSDVAHVVDPAGRGDGTRYDSVAAALSAVLPAGTVGVESEDMEIGLYRAFGLDDRDTAYCDIPVRAWRDAVAGRDLPYYVIAARTSAHAIDGALAFAGREIAAGRTITEKDVDAVYFRLLHEYVGATGLPLRVTRYMTNHHSGTRTPYPANPAPFVVDGSARTLKIDSGCLIYGDAPDNKGVLLGVSDIARTLNLTPEAEEIYPLIVDGVRDTLIPGAKVGTVAEDLFEIGVAAVWDKRDSLASDRLTPALPVPLADLYHRDVGHLLGRNDLATLRFQRGDKGVLTDGMVACLEYQWPVDGHALAYEDTCVVTPDGGLNFTSDDWA